MRLPNKLEHSLAAIAIAGALLISSSVYVTRSTLNSAIEENATLQAHGWADYLVKALPDLEEIAAGAREFEVEFSAPDTRVFLYKKKE